MVADIFTHFPTIKKVPTAKPLGDRMLVFAYINVKSDRMINFLQLYVKFAGTMFVLSESKHKASGNYTGL